MCIRDREKASGVDHFVAISNFIAARIRKFYGRKSSVIYPPVDTHRFVRGQTVYAKKPDRPFLFASASAPYKGLEQVIAVFNKMNLPLNCVGGGALHSKLKARAKSHIRFLGRVSDAQLARLYSESRALVFPAKEDFGIIPIEALASGTPVICGYHGALRETVRGVKPWVSESLLPDQHTGVFFNPGTGDFSGALQSSIEYFIKNEDAFSSKIIQESSTIFSGDNFFKRWKSFEEGGFSQDWRDSSSHSKNVNSNCSKAEEKAGKKASEKIGNCDSTTTVVGL